MPDGQSVRKKVAGVAAGAANGYYHAGPVGAVAGAVASHKLGPDALAANAAHSVGYHGARAVGLNPVQAHGVAGVAAGVTVAARRVGRRLAHTAREVRADAAVRSENRAKVAQGSKYSGPKKVQGAPTKPERNVRSYQGSIAASIKTKSPLPHLAWQAKHGPKGVEGVTNKQFKTPSRSPARNSSRPVTQAMGKTLRPYKNQPKIHSALDRIAAAPRRKVFGFGRRSRAIAHASE